MIYGCLLFYNIFSVAAILVETHYKEKTVATVVDFAKRANYNENQDFTGYSFYPIFEFGNTTVKYEYICDEEKIKVGDKIELYFNPKKPTEIYKDITKSLSFPYFC
jgi:hypothetical protein